MRNPFKSRKAESDLEKELRFHVEEHTQSFLDQGHSPREARRRALLDFGGMAQVSEECRDVRAMRWIDGIHRDARYAFGLIRKQPLFAAAIVLTLGVCIGAVTAVFSIVDSTMLRPLPYPDPERLGELVIRSQFKGVEELQSSQNGATWEHFRKSIDTVDLAVYTEGAGNLNFSSGGEAGYIRQQRVGSGFFRVFGIPLAVGREFTPEEDVQYGPSIAVLSYSFWRRAFGSDPGITGRRVTIAGTDYRVVGVASPDFQSTADVWTPLRPSQTGEGQGRNYRIMGRLKAGVDWAQGDGEIASIGQSALPRYRSGVTARFGLMPLQEVAMTSLAGSLWMVFAAAILVLVIGCANIAGMLMARGASRRSEIATRMAIGASRLTIVRQLLTESLTLAAAGAIVGVFIGYVSLDWIQTILPPEFSALQDVKLDFRVLMAIGAVATITSLMFGLFPALQASRVDIRTAQSGRGIAGPKRSIARRTLSTVQIAIAVAILIGAGLLVRSFRHLSTLESGLDATNVITANFALLDARYSTSEAANRYFDQVLTRLNQLPGVEASAVAHSLPYERGLNTVFKKPGDLDDGSARLTNWSYISPGFFDVLRVPVLSGRGITDSDGTGSVRVAVINDAFAKRHFKNENPVGSRVRVFGGEELQIVGVVGDVLQQAGWGNFGPMAKIPTLYTPVAQPGANGLSAASPSWVVRTTGAPADIQKQIESVVKAVDPMLPVAAFRSLNEINLRSLALQRFMATLLAIAAVLALLLAGIGTYAMISNSVTERTREFGIRIALGASVGRTIRSSAVSGMMCAAIGLTIGLVLARMGSRLLDGMLYGIMPMDGLTYASVAAGVLAVAAVASLIPALRIAKVDPSQTLRHE